MRFSHFAVFAATLVCAVWAATLEQPPNYVSQLLQSQPPQMTPAVLSLSSNVDEGNGFIDDYVRDRQMIRLAQQIERTPQPMDSLDFFPRVTRPSDAPPERVEEPDGIEMVAPGNSEPAMARRSDRCDCGPDCQCGSRCQCGDVARDLDRLTASVEALVQGIQSSQPVRAVSQSSQSSQPDRIERSERPARKSVMRYVDWIISKYDGEPEPPRHGAIADYLTERYDLSLEELDGLSVAELETLNGALSYASPREWAEAYEAAREIAKHERVMSILERTAERQPVMPVQWSSPAPSRRVYSRSYSSWSTSPTYSMPAYPSYSSPSYSYPSYSSPRYSSPRYSSPYVPRYSMPRSRCVNGICY